MIERPRRLARTTLYTAACTLLLMVPAFGAIGTAPAAAAKKRHAAKSASPSGELTKKIKKGEKQLKHQLSKGEKQLKKEAASGQAQLEEKLGGGSSPEGPSPEQLEEGKKQL